MNNKKILIVTVLVLFIAAFFFFDLGQYLTLDYFKSQRDAISAYQDANPLQTALVFFLVYVAVTGLSLPGAAVLTLAAGAIFGLWWGVFIVSFASTLGATIAFLVARLLMRDWVQNKFGQKLKAINQGIEREGAFYLFTLRLVPIFPFFVINLVMGLTPIRVVQFFFVSQVGMLAGTFVYVNAGTQLAQIESLSGILSPGLLLSFVLLGIFPLLAKKLVDVVKAQKVYKDYEKPKNFDANLVVIGAGSGGLVAAYIAAAVKAKVYLIEKHQMGGDCLNTGCVPSKALIRSAKINRYLQRAAEFGLQASPGGVDFAAVMQRVHGIIKTIEPHDSVERFTGLGVDCIQGEARITSPWSVEVNGQSIHTKNIIIASGARPFVPPIEGLADVGYLTSDTLWQLEQQPKRLLVIGAGPIGCELAQSFARLGSEVILLDMADKVMPREDTDVSAFIAEKLEADGVELRLSHKTVKFSKEGETKTLQVEHEGQEFGIVFDEVLVAVGRRANTEGFGLQELNIGTTPQGTLQVNEYLQTRFPNIYACGDVAGPYQFTHTASHQAWYAAVNALFGRFKKYKVDYSVIPWATFTDPEVARVGLNEADAKQQGVDYEVTQYAIDDLDRAIAEGEAQGWVKVLTVPGKDKILGVTIVGAHAGELIGEYILAMKHGLGLNKILGTIHIYPTFSEANKFAAGNWKKVHKPEKLLAYVERFHAWMRGA
ncbi:FAD-dependent NAD(P)-disulfide oxidoreductase [gamma proteobacterium IMCC2047]|nr:FAD-dependent NAD(P)-disulfide oxidoreductase [gamma proteobacterium IMCC2047]